MEDKRTVRQCAGAMTIDAIAIQEGFMKIYWNCNLGSGEVVISPEKDTVVFFGLCGFEGNRERDLAELILETLEEEGEINLVDSSLIELSKKRGCQLDICEATFEPKQMRVRYGIEGRQNELVLREIEGTKWSFEVRHTHPKHPRILVRAIMRKLARSGRMGD